MAALAKRVKSIVLEATQNLLAQELGDSIANGIAAVTDTAEWSVSVDNISSSETMVRLHIDGMHPRYFNVKIKEML